MAAPESSPFFWDELPSEMHGEIAKRFSFFPWGSAALLLLGHTSKVNFRKYAKGLRGYKEANKTPSVALMASALASSSWAPFLYFCPEPLFYFNLKKSSRKFMAERRILTMAAGISGDLKFVRQWHEYLYGNIPRNLKSRRVEHTHLASVAGMLPYRSLEIPLIESLKIWEAKNNPSLMSYCREEEREPFPILVAKYGTGSDMDLASDHGYFAAKWAFDVACEYGNVSILKWMLRNRSLVLFYSMENFNNRTLSVVKSKFSGQVFRVILDDDRSATFILDPQCKLLQNADEKKSEPVLEMIMEDGRFSPLLTLAGINLPYACKRGYTRIVHKLLQLPDVDPNEYFMGSSTIGNAVISGMVETVRFLLTHPRFDAIPNQAAFIIACYKSNAAILKLFLTNPKFDIAKLGPQGLRMKLLNFDNFDDDEVLKLLMEDGRFDPMPVLNDIASSNCWQMAIISPTALEYLLKDGRMDPNLFNGILLRNFVVRSKEDNVRVLLKDPRVIPSIMKNEALKRACEYGYSGIATLLLDHPKIDLTIEIDMILKYACKNGLALHLLLSRLGHVESSLFTTALNDSCANGYLDAVKQLLAHPGIDLALSGREILKVAIRRGRTAVVQLLLEDGRIDPTSNGCECLSIARGLGKKDIIDALGMDSRVKNATSSGPV